MKDEDRSDLIVYIVLAILFIRSFILMVREPWW